MERSQPHLKLRRIVTMALVLALGVPVVFSLMPGCDSTPALPEYDNPFDPLGPDAGDPLKLTATSQNDATIDLLWNQPQDMGITRYAISTSAYRDSNWSDLTEVDQTTTSTNSFTHEEPDATSIHWYRVQAFTDTEFTITSYATPDSATTPPRVDIGDGSGTSATRFIGLQITVTQGDQVRIALDADFTESLVVVPAGAPGEPIDLTYDLGPAAANNELKTIFVESFGDGYVSRPSEQTVLVDFKPAFTIVGAPSTVATRTVDLTIPTEGVLNMRFFAEYADTATTPWVPVSDTYLGYELSDSANSQFIRGQFQGDFGFSSLGEYEVTPDLLTSVTFNLVLPDDHISDLTTVPGASRAVATEMRYAESADLSAAPWIAYADTVQVILTPAPGHKVIYVQYRNDWTQSGTLNDYVIHVTQPAEVTFWAPGDGDVINGGAVFQVRGGSTVGSGEGSVILVKFDSGDGNGFVNADGTDAWTYLWNVPRFNADTQVVLRAQAFYGPDPAEPESITTDITVTVTQLTATITAPVDGADLIGNKPTIFTGTAAGVLNGTALDRVTLDIGSELVEATGTTNWSYEWTAPLWEADSTLTVAATAWAGADTAMTSIQVNVIRPPVAITEPVLNDLVDGDTDLTITGITFADLFTVPVETVVVDIESDAGSATLPATGTDSWSVIWPTPDVAINTQAQIIATATAGAESKADTISVTVKP